VGDGKDVSMADVVIRTSFLSQTLNQDSGSFEMIFN